MRLRHTALLLCDLQNDFLHPDGAYGRAGLVNTDITALPGRLAPVAAHIRHAGGWIVATHFTLVPGRDGAPLISPHLQKLRPFLGTGDFAPGCWGHATVDQLQPLDFTVEKIAYSAFYMTRLEWLLRRCHIKTLLVAGIVTNGGISSTIRDAQVRDFDTLLLADGCAAFDRGTHATAVSALASVCTVTTINSWLEHSIRK